MTTDQVKLRLLEFSDKEQLARLANNKKVWDNLRDFFPYPYSEQDAVDFINFSKSETSQKNFAIEFEGMLCGVISLIQQEDVYAKSAEIGYWLGEPFWGKGIATKAVELITTYGFNELNLVRIFCGVFAYNHASMKVLEKNGFRNDGVFEKAVVKNGKTWDEYRYSKLNQQ